MSSTELDGTPHFATPTDREFVATVDFNAPQQLLFDVWTQPEHLSRWMLGPEGWTMPVCEIDPRPGGKWRCVWRGTDGAEMVIQGEYREVAPPQRIVSTESWGGDWPETINTIELSGHNGRTTMSHTIFYPSRKARDSALATGMKDGMTMSFKRLAKYLNQLK